MISPQTSLLCTSSYLIAWSLFLAILSGYATSLTNATSSTLALAILGSFLSFLSIFGFIGARKERNWMLLCYFYFLLILSFFLLFFSTTIIFSQSTLKSYIEHHWESSQLDNLRSKVCCTTIEDSVHYLKKFYRYIGFAGYLCFLINLFAMYAAIHVLTLPIIMRNILTIVNMMFVISGSLIIFFGSLLHSDGIQNPAKPWIDYLIISVGGVIFVLATFGYIGAKAKSRLVLLLYEIGGFICFLCLIAAVVGSFIYTRDLSKQYDSIELQDIACQAKLKGCSNCTDIIPCNGVYQEKNLWYECGTAESKPVFPISLNTTDDPAIQRNQTDDKCTHGLTVIHEPKSQNFYSLNVGICGKCPQWSNHDVINIIKTKIEFLGLISVLMTILVLVGITAAWILRKSLKGYQTDSV